MKFYGFGTRVLRPSRILATTDYASSQAPIAFPRDLNNSFGEYLSGLGKTQCACETEKWHVTSSLTG